MYKLCVKIINLLTTHTPFTQSLTDAYKSSRRGQSLLIEHPEILVPFAYVFVTRSDPGAQHEEPPNEGQPVGQSMLLHDGYKADTLQ